MKEQKQKQSEREGLRMTPALRVALVNRSREWGRPKTRIIHDALLFWFCKPEDERIRELRKLQDGGKAPSFDVEPLTCIPLTEGTTGVHTAIAVVSAVRDGIVGVASSILAGSTSLVERGSRNGKRSILPRAGVPVASDPFCGPAEAFA